MAGIADDTVITKFILDPTGYITGSRAISNTTDALKSGIGQLGSIVSGVAIGVAALGAGIGAFAYKAMQAAAEFESMERIFGAGLGSMDAGRQMMASLEDYANRSAFSLRDLTVAAKSLVAGGFDVGRFLPVMERFALVINGVDPEGLQMVARAMMLAKGGAFGEAMETLRRAGITAQDIARESGAQVTKGGQFTGTEEQFLNAIVKLSEGRVKDMADSLQTSAETAMSNVGDILGQAFRQAGTELNTTFLPMVRTATEHFKLLVDAGVIKSITDGFTDLFNATEGEGGLIGAIDDTALALMSLPGILRAFGSGLEFVAGMLFNLSGLGIINGIDQATGGHLSELLFGQAKGIGQAFKDGYGVSEKEIELQSLKEARQRKQAKEVKSDIPFPTTPEPPDKMPFDTEPVKVLRQIADNTKSLKEISERVLGGGATGRAAFNSVNLGKIASGGSGSELERKIRGLVEAVQIETLRTMTSTGNR